MTNDQNAPERLFLNLGEHNVAIVYRSMENDAGPLVEYIRADIHEAVVKDQEELRKRMTLLFKCIAPECEPFDYCHGLLSQIDNAIYGMKQKIEKLTGRPVPLTEWQKLELERDALQRQLAQCRREALEEAAHMCGNSELTWHGCGKDCETAIRKLIDEGGT